MDINTVTHNQALCENLDNLLTKSTGHADTGVCCPACGGVVTAFVQPALLPNRPDRLYVTCLNPLCVGATTRCVDDWLDLVLHAGVKGAA